MTAQETLILQDQQKALNFCLDQIQLIHTEEIPENLKEPYKILAMVAIANIVTLLDDLPPEA